MEGQQSHDISRNEHSKRHINCVETEVVGRYAGVTCGVHLPCEVDGINVLAVELD